MREMCCNNFLFYFLKKGFLKEAGAGYHGHSKQILQLPAQEIKLPYKCCLTARARSHSIVQPDSSKFRHSGCLPLPRALQLVETISYGGGRYPLSNPWHRSKSAVAIGLGKFILMYRRMQEGSRRLRPKSPQPNILSSTLDPKGRVEEQGKHMRIYFS